MFRKMKIKIIVQINWIIVDFSFKRVTLEMNIEFVVRRIELHMEQFCGSLYLVQDVRTLKLLYNV